MAIGNPSVYADFSGGINRQAGPYLLQENQCQDARNVYANTLGALTKRHGFSSFSTIKTSANANALDGRAHSLTTAHLTSTRYLLAVGKTPSASTDSIVSINESGVANVLKTGLTQNKRWEFVQAPVVSANEVQTVTISATGGTFTLTYSGQTTSAINYNASADDVANALVALSNIGAGEVQVTKVNSVYTVVFTGTLGGSNLTQMTGDGSSLTGGTEPRLTIATVTNGTTEGPIYGVNGTDTPQYWSGASASTATSNWTAVNSLGTLIDPHPAKNCKYLVYHLDKLWASGDSSKPGRIYSSGVDANGLPDPRNWDSDYTDDIEPADGEQITGIGKVGPYLLVFKPRKTYVLTDPANRAYRPVSSSIGCISHRSIAETAQGTMFLSDDLGICITDGASVTPMSDAIDPFLMDVFENEAVDLENAAGVYYDNSYWLSLPTNGTNAITIQYSFETESWWFHTCASNQYALLDPLGAPKLYSAQPAAQRIERAFDPDSYEDAAGAFESYWEGPFWAWGAPHINKRLHQLRADGKGFWQMSIKESFNRPYEGPLDEIIWEGPTGTAENYGEGSSDFGDADTTIVFGSEQGIIQKRYSTPARGWGRAWSLKVSDSGAGGNEVMELYAVTAFVRTRSD